MCNDSCFSSTRATQGGAIAVLKPIVDCSMRPFSPPPPSASSAREVCLRLAQDREKGRTTAVIDGLEDEAGVESWLVIHRDGDLRNPDAPWEEDSVMLRVCVPGKARDRVPFYLERSLDLGVGAEGVIGRRVSFLKGRRVVGQGIMGWN